GDRVPNFTDVVRITDEVPSGVPFVPVQNWAITSNRRILYVGVGSWESRSDYQGRLHQVSIVDTMSGEQIGTIPLPIDFFSLALSRDDQTLYAVNPGERSISSIDPTTRSVKAVIGNIGTLPVIAASVP